jgi:hypothetical protein
VDLVLLDLHDQTYLTYLTYLTYPTYPTYLTYPTNQTDPDLKSPHRSRQRIRRRDEPLRRIGRLPFKFRQSSSGRHAARCCTS